MEGKLDQKRQPRGWKWKLQSEKIVFVLLAFSKSLADSRAEQSRSLQRLPLEDVHVYQDVRRIPQQDKSFTTR
jgi:hypothetical protein